MILKKYITLFLVFIIIISFNGCKAVERAVQEQTALEDAANQESSPFEFVGSAREPVVTDGFIRLILNERRGSFSLSYAPNAFSSLYEPLFISRNTTSSSYISVSVNGKIYRLGRSRAFSTAIERYDGDPALVFESPFLKVTQVFTPVRTPASSNSNGIRLSIIVQNTGETVADVGIRFLLDTALGEKKGMVPFITNNQKITSETLVTGSSDDRFWMSADETVSLMGSIINPVDGNGIIPDFVHFANWKRLNEARWRLRYTEGRSFTNFPYSVNDSAVCYFYEPTPLAIGASVTYVIFLTTEDISWYILPDDDIINMYIVRNVFNRTVDLVTMDDAALIEARRSNPNIERVTFHLLEQVLSQFVAGEIILGEQSLEEIERIINRHRNQRIDNER